MSAVVVVDVVGDDVPPPTTGVAADKEKQPSSLPRSHCLEFVGRALLQLCASFAVLLIGSTIALYLFYTLGDIQRVNVRTIYNRRAGQLAEGLQSQIHSVQVGPSFRTRCQLHVNPDPPQQESVQHTLVQYLEHVARLYWYSYRWFTEPPRAFALPVDTLFLPHPPKASTPLALFG
jgi:hypothetical protein